MKDHPYTKEEVDFNASLDAADVLKKMGYTPDSIRVEEGLIRIFCPIHKDQARRSLLIDDDERTFRCQYTACPAHKGGLLVGLYAMYIQMPVPEAIRFLTGGVDKSHETELLDAAHRLIETRRFDDTLPFLIKAREVNPSNTITRCKLGALYLEMGRRQEGHKEYLAAAEDFGVKGELDKTLSIYNLLVILSPKDITVRRQMAYLFSRLGRPEEAADHLKWAVDQYLALGRIDEAAVMCERMAELTPNEPLIHTMLADILLDNGAIEQAMAPYEKAATLLAGRDEFEKARELVTKALRYVPGNPGLVSLRNRIDGQLKQLHAATSPQRGAVVVQALVQSEEEDDFAQWIASLEEEIDKPAPAAEPDSLDISPEDARVLMCRANLRGLDEKKMRSMEHFLKDMYHDVRQNFAQGLMTPEELRVIKDFYKSFCVAFEQIKRESKF